MRMFWNRLRGAVPWSRDSRQARLPRQGHDTALLIVAFIIRSTAFTGHRWLPIFSGSPGSFPEFDLSAKNRQKWRDIQNSNLFSSLQPWGGIKSIKFVPPTLTEIKFCSFWAQVISWVRQVFFGLFAQPPFYSTNRDNMGILLRGRRCLQKRMMEPNVDKELFLQEKHQYSDV